MKNERVFHAQNLIQERIRKGIERNRGLNSEGNRMIMEQENVVMEKRRTIQNKSHEGCLLIKILEYR